MIQEPAYTIHANGDRSVRVNFGDNLSDHVYFQVIHLLNSLRADSLPGIEDLVPSYTSLTIYFDPAKLRQNQNGRTIFDFWSSEIAGRVQRIEGLPMPGGRDMEIPVCYDIELAADLSAVALSTGLSINEIVRLHCGQPYRVYLIGFLPGFPYLGTLPVELQLPRKQIPTNVPAGSVAIAGLQSGIYPVQSPGGWHVIGRTPLSIFDSSLPEPCLLQAGDLVQFTPISKHEYDRINRRFAG
ncbi:MAG: 5-oxoprolinase subunit PxpB [Chitinophagaceae bacterium]